MHPNSVNLIELNNVVLNVIRNAKHPTAGDNPISERFTWNGNRWVTIGNSDYPRYYVCRKDTYETFWQAGVTSNPDQYYNPRIFVNGVDRVPANTDNSASQWCRLVPGKNYTFGKSYLAGDNPKGDRYHWNGFYWDKLPAPSDYPRYYLCYGGAIDGTGVASSGGSSQGSGNCIPLIVDGRYRGCQQNN